MTQYTNDDVFAIAKTQRVIIWLVLASLVDFVFPPAFIIITFFKIMFVYSLAGELKLNDSWAWFVCMLIPLVNIILLLKLNAKATAIIRSKGVKVGLMGANKVQLVKLAATI
jgi:hypothetical protein